MIKGKLHLIPNTLGGDNLAYTIPTGLSTLVTGITHYIVENPKIARRFLKSIQIAIPLSELHMFTLNKHTDTNELASFLAAAHEGKDIGLISDAGCPGVADPGADIVRLAHLQNIQVVPHVGPSSILMALMSSGMNGQTFCFHGYLPKEQKDRIQALKDLEYSVRKTGGSQIFMDTPFRNEHLFEDLLKYCHPETLLCIAADISMNTEYIRTQSIAAWKKSKPQIHKRPCMFVMGR